ncbi:mercuric transport protein MerT [Bacillus sp. B1-b2]|uniref:mercuric transport protein MerT n=1 Tax=Bacillus sp. B1-b2 TaxID=2653201 RepID=UPI0012626587|nr:mercuric transport protein MerT [Bacillus sp. B1-b2]KAB7664151.1 mercuric transport protein MerT [Bacillus sp. B1-b2]
MKEKVSQVATVFSAFVMAGCCLGPLILIPIGLTGFAGAIAFYSLKYRILFSIVTIVLLAYSFYMVYGRKGKRKSSVIGLWITTVFVFGMFLFLFMVEGGI